MILDLLIFAGSALLLWFCADWIVDGASALARRWGVSELVIGLTVVAFGTSAPEFLVTLTAAMRGLSDLSLSNVVGSNIFNLGVILGGMALIRPLPTHPTLVWRDGLLLFLTTAVILAGAAFMNQLGRAFGLVLVALLVGYLLFLFRRGQRLHLEDEEPEAEPDAAEPENGASLLKDSLKLLAGFVGISVGGHFMVDSATAIATSLGVSQWAIGVTIVAAGTSLPELVTCLAASMRGRNDMLLGNLIGSDFFNFAGVLGLTCILRPLHVGPEAVQSLVVLVSMVGVCLFFMRTGWRVSRLEGGILMAVSLLRWAQDLL